MNRYFTFVSEIASGTSSIVRTGPPAGPLQGQAHGELVKTLKASCYLLLYNLTESTMRNVIQAIFDDFRQQGVSFDDCRDEVRRIVLQNLRQRNPDKILVALHDVARDMITTTFDAEEQFSGNIDARQIRETAERFGFSPPETRVGWPMLEVKTNRNDLAHGSKSFSDVGKDLTPERLRLARKHTVVVLTITIRNVAKYLSEQKYLAARV